MLHWRWRSFAWSSWAFCCSFAKCTEWSQSEGYGRDVHTCKIEFLHVFFSRMMRLFVQVSSEESHACRLLGNGASYSRHMARTLGFSMAWLDMLWALPPTPVRSSISLPSSRSTMWGKCSEMMCWHPTCQAVWGRPCLHCQRPSSRAAFELGSDDYLQSTASTFHYQMEQRDLVLFPWASWGFPLRHWKTTLQRSVTSCGAACLGCLLQSAPDLNGLRYRENR